MEGKAVEELVGTTKADIALAQINVGETELAKRIYGRCGLIKISTMGINQTIFYKRRADETVQCNCKGELEF
jgi:hypothetical protein